MKKILSLFTLIVAYTSFGQGVVGSTIKMNTTPIENNQSPYIINWNPTTKLLNYVSKDSLRSGGSIGQDNIDKVITIELQDEQSIGNIVSTVNALQYSVGETESTWIKVIYKEILEEFGILTRVELYKVINKGKGTLQLATSNPYEDLLFIYNEKPSVVDYEDLASTQNVNLGWNIASTNISDYVNNLTTPITFQDQEDGYVIIKVINNGIEESYLFLGQGGIYGQGQLQSVTEDYQLIPGESSGGQVTISDVSATESGIVNNTAMQELGGVDKTINGVTIGKGAGSNNDSTTLGLETLFSNTSGTYNTALGTYNLYYNTTGSENTAVGSYSLVNNESGSYNTATGKYSLYTNIRGIGNTSAGNSSMYSNISGNYNDGFGYGTLFYNQFGSYNVAIGSYALNNNAGVAGSNVFGSRSVAIGHQAMYYNTTGNGIGIGNFSLYYQSTGVDNIGIGNQAGSGITTGNRNTILGGTGFVTAGGGITSGNDNLIVSSNNGNTTGITEGNGNVILGKVEGLDFNLENNIVLADGIGNISLRKVSDGTVILPNQTLALIDADTIGKSIVTKEWVQANSGGSVNSFQDVLGVNNQSVIPTQLNGAPYLIANSEGAVTGGMTENSGGVTIFSNNTFSVSPSGGYFNAGAEGRWSSSSSAEIDSNGSITLTANQLTLSAGEGITLNALIQTDSTITRGLARNLDGKLVEFDIPTGGGGGDLQSALSAGSTASVATPISISSDGGLGNITVNNGVTINGQAGKITLALSAGGVDYYGTNGKIIAGNQSELNIAGNSSTAKGQLRFDASGAELNSQSGALVLGGSGGITLSTPILPDNTVTKGLAKNTSGRLVEFDIPSGGGGGMTNPMTTQYDMIVGGTSGAPTRMASSAINQVMITPGFNAQPTWGKVGLTTHVSGTLPIANGGTGTTTGISAAQATINSSKASLSQVQTDIAIVSDLTVALVVPNLHKYYGLTGTGAVASLPPIAGNVGKTITVMNKTSNAQGVYSNDGESTDIISSTGAVNAVTIPIYKALVFFNDGVHWVVID